MTQALYIAVDPVAGRAKANTLGCGWLPAVPAGLVAVAPCAIVIGGNGVQVFSDNPPLTPSVVLAAIAADVALDAAAAAAQAVLDGNAATLRGKAQTALAVNATYLALGAPTVAQNTAQVQALTRQVNALIRLVGSILDSTANT